MSVVSALNDQQWTLLLDHAAETYNEVTLSRGFLLFKQTKVATLFVSEQRVVQARVEDAETCQVTLPLQNPSNSRCTCPAGEACKHLAAVMMELADRLGYSPTQIANAKQRPKQSAIQANSAQPDSKSLPTMTVPDWHAYFDTLVSSIRMTYDPKLYMELLRNQFQQLNRHKSSFPADMWNFFELHQELFLFQKLKINLQSGHGYYTSSALLQACDEIGAWIHQKKSHFKLPPIHDSHFPETLAYLREKLAEETNSKYIYYGIASVLWKEWGFLAPNHDEWVQKEVKELEKLASQTPSTSAAKAFLLLQLSESETAWEALQAGGSMNAIPLPIMTAFFEQLTGDEDWEGLVAWLERTVDLFYGKRSSYVQVYIRYWKQACEHLPQAEASLWAILEEMLPHSVNIIEELLYEQKKWKPWIEMQILQNHDPLFHRVAVLQPIEKEAAELLLPYYHQAVDRYVGLKTRHDYKSAVKLLKRLEKVYKKLKREDRWETFLHGFAAQNSRLRALQEEMKKGKLLS